MAYIHLVSFCNQIIETRVTKKASVVDNWVHKIQSMYNGQQHMVVGLDCNWKRHPINSMSSKIATLQLCIDTKCLILQLLYMDYIPQSIKIFLSDSKFAFVGVEIGEVVSKLRNEYELCCSKTMDVRALAKIFFPLSFHGKPSLKALSYQLVQLSMRKPKHGCRRNWESRVLDQEQVEYACVDGYASYRIGHKLLNEM